MRLSGAVLALALVVPAVPLAKEPARPAREVPAVVLARFVLSEEAWTKMRNATAVQLQQYFDGTFRQAGAEPPAGFAAQFAEEFATVLSYQEVIDLQASVLAKYYTDAEIDQLLAFYQTKLGQKVIRTMPELSQDLNGQLLAIVQQRMPAMIERMKTLPPAAKAEPAR